MTPEELQQWLLDEGVASQLRSIACKTARLEFEGLSSEDEMEEIDWPEVLLAGSILSRSDLRRMEEAALRIGTGALLLPNDQRFRDAGAVLLDKMSNRRAVDLAEARDLIPKDLTERLGIAARLEAARRGIDRTVLEQFTGEWLPVNPFQESVWSRATSGSGWLSVSAPTAAGKSFLVQRWLVDRLLSGNDQVAIYIAPTRALVSEVELCIQEIIKEHAVDKLIQVASLPLPQAYKEAVAGLKKLILVFTQERLHLLANAVGGEINSEVLVVDEAHKIGDGGRGVILQEAVERLSRKNPSLQVLFVSPATQNPGVLLQDAPDNAARETVDSDVPMVIQNLLTAKQVRGRSTEWELALRYRNEDLRLGILSLPARPNSIKKKVAFIAAAAGSRGGTLVYANGAAEAESIALLISQVASVAGEVDSELEDLADLARKGVHPSYQLARVAVRGVAFHYGNMPSLLRTEIERLFRNGKIKFLVCTSTLVEGVNLSCRTIIVRGPRKGRGKPMQAPDFWNLAGRAGRWGNEFQGNIICIDPQDKSAWPQGVPERTRFPIERETDAVLARRDDIEAFLSDRPNLSVDSLARHAELEQVAAYLLATFLRCGSVGEAPFAKRHHPAFMQRLDTVLTEHAAGVELPVELIARHPGVSALGLQRLLTYFRERSGSVEDLLPPIVEADDAYVQMCSMMHRVNANVYPAFGPEARVPLFALVVLEWLKGHPLSLMIRKRLDYHRRHDQPVQLGQVIRSTMELVEQVARFRAPKYLSAYVDVLRFYLEEIDRSDLLNDDLEIGIALEFGVSSRTLLSLMELGLSRMSAVALNELVAQQDLSKDGCVQWIVEHRSVIETADLPIVVVREVLSLA